MSEKYIKLSNSDLKKSWLTWIMFDCCSNNWERMQNIDWTIAMIPTLRKLYPDDKLLVIEPKKFTPSKRVDYFLDIIEGGYVACYIAYSSFDMIRMSKQYYIEELKEELLKVRRSIQQNPGVLVTER